MKMIKALFAFFLGVIALSVLGLTSLALVFDSEAYKETLIQKVQEATGRKLCFETEITLSFFPWVALETGTVTLSNPTDFNSDTMLRLDSVLAELKILPLCIGKIELGKMYVQGIHLHLMRNESEQSNWEDLLAYIPTELDNTQQKQPEEQRRNFDFSLSGVNISNADIFWEDVAQGKKYSIHDAEIVLGSLKANSPVEFASSACFFSADRQTQIDMQLKGSVGFDAESRKLELDDIVLAVEAVGDLVPGKKGTAQFVAENLGISLNNHLVSLSQFNCSAYGLEVAGTLTGKSFLDVPTVAGDLTIRPFNLKKIFTLLSKDFPQLANADALSSIGGQIKFSYMPEIFDAPEILLNIDGAKATAQIKVEGFSNPVIYVRGTIDELDVDKYFLFSHQAEAGLQNAQAQGASEKETLSDLEKEVLEVIRELNVDAIFNADKVEVCKMQLSGLKARVLAKNGLLEITPASFGLYGGNISCTSRLDASGSRLRTILSLTSSGIHAGSVLEEIFGQTGFKGTAQLQTQAPLTFVGVDSDSITASLYGSVHCHISDGFFSGADLLTFFAESEKFGEHNVSALEGKTEDRTNFSELSALVNVNAGVLDAENICLRSPLLRAMGQAHIDATQQQVNGLAVALLVDENQGDVLCSNAVGQGMPIRITGDFLKPKVYVDAQELRFLKTLEPRTLAEYLTALP